jgi:carboxypeptidase PM20D1
VWPKRPVTAPRLPRHWWIGATDGRYATAITPRVYRFSPAVITPVDLTGFHGTNERMSVENMGRISNGFAQIIVAMDQGD